jgi:hypothetical protein
MNPQVLPRRPPDARVAIRRRHRARREGIRHDTLDTQEEEEEEKKEKEVWKS